MSDARYQFWMMLDRLCEYLAMKFFRLGYWNLMEARNYCGRRAQR